MILGGETNWRQRKVADSTIISTAVCICPDMLTNAGRMYIPPELKWKDKVTATQVLPSDPHVETSHSLKASSTYSLIILDSN
jgi:hypothetical protein